MLRICVLDMEVKLIHQIHLAGVAGAQCRQNADFAHAFFLGAYGHILDVLLIDKQQRISNGADQPANWPLTAQMAWCWTVAMRTDSSQKIKL